MTVLADSGALYALMDRGDEWHQRVFDWYTSTTQDLLVPVTVLPEVTYMLARRIGARAEEQFVREVAAGDFTLEPFDSADLPRIADLLGAYSDLPLGFVDASIVAIAERLDIGTLLTTDRRHFGVVRPAHCERLRLLP